MTNIITTLARKTFRNLRYEIKFSKSLGELEGKIQILTSESLKAKGRIAVRFLKSGEEIVCRNYKVIKNCVLLEDEGADTWMLCTENGFELFMNSQYPRMFYCAEFGDELLLYDSFSEAVVIKNWDNELEVVKRYSKSKGNYFSCDHTLVLTDGDKQHVIIRGKVIGAYDIVKAINTGTTLVCKNVDAPDKNYVIYNDGGVEIYKSAIVSGNFLFVSKDGKRYGVIIAYRIVIPLEYEEFEAMGFGVTFAKRYGESDYVLVEYAWEFKEFPERYREIVSFFEEKEVGLFKMKVAKVIDTNGRTKYINTLGEEVAVEKFQSD